MSPNTRHLAIVGAALAGALAAGVCIGRAEAQTPPRRAEPPILGLESLAYPDGMARLIRAGLARFTDGELAHVRAVVVALLIRTDPALTVIPSLGGMGTRGNTCGEAWPEPAYHYAIIAAWAPCDVTETTVHEVCHLVAADAGGTDHGPPWARCMHDHGLAIPLGNVQPDTAALIAAWEGAQ